MAKAVELALEALVQNVAMADIQTIATLHNINYVTPQKLEPLTASDFGHAETSESL